MTEHPTLIIGTSIEDETVEIALLDGGRIEIAIRIYDAKIDSFISNIVEIQSAQDVNDLGARLVEHSDSAALPASSDLDVTVTLRSVRQPTATPPELSPLVVDYNQTSRIPRPVWDNLIAALATQKASKR